MENQDFNSSVLLLGPKAVGKSLFSPKIQEKLGMKMVISVDRLYSFVHMQLQGFLDNFDSYKQGITQIVQEQRLDTTRPNYQELKELQLRRIDEFFSMIKGYMSVIDFKKLEGVGREIITFNKFSKQCEGISPDVLYHINQLLKLKMVITAIQDIHFPIVLDASAEFGLNCNFTFYEFIWAANLLAKFGIDVSSVDVNFLNKFGSRVYLKPGKDYSSIIDKRIASPDNKFYLSQEGAYKKFANIEIVVDKIFKNTKDPSFMHQSESFNVAAEQDFFKNINEKGFKKVLDEITEKILLNQYNKNKN